MNNCLHCQKETKNPKFCSRSCAASYNNVVTPKKKTKKKCIICGEPVKNHRTSRCSIHQQEYLETRFDYIKDLTLDHYWAKKSLENLHASSKNVHIRHYARSRSKDILSFPCACCGYDKHVELCHIKPISSFKGSATMGEVNHPSNLIQLCPNCHWEFDNKLLFLDFPDQSESH